MKWIILLPIAASSSLLFSSCAQNSITGDTYQRGEAGRAQSVLTGTVTSVRNVKIEGDADTGKWVGAIAGGILGHELGDDGWSRAAGSAAGAAVGSAVGSHTSKALGSEQGVEINVQLDNGRSMSVVQAFNPNERFNVGDKVRILGGGGRTRVTH
ncbi:glycine zipper 2TM domain-containing protein [Rubritalea marina]|uniref:glycine zipper 2TM domain-containing protein n=1 Tax=Rubritalea marina TaxID=361055 RepID=UPI000376E9C8|nr:glycine zipper 2TM domain-containing protein [Rubritalea marina]